MESNTSPSSKPLEKPTYDELLKALDELHIVCETSTVPEVEDWYRNDQFASVARSNAAEILTRHAMASRMSLKSEGGNESHA